MLKHCLLHKYKESKKNMMRVIQFLRFSNINNEKYGKELLIVILK